MLRHYSDITKAITIVLLFFIKTVFCAVDYAGESAPFMKMGGGAASLGLGGAVVASCSDVSAALWNPARLTYMPFFELTAMHTRLFSDTYYDYAGFGTRITSNLAFSLSYLRLESDNIEKTAVVVDQNGNPVITKIYGQDAVKVDITDYLVFLNQAVIASAAYRFQSISIGMNIKYLHMELEKTAWGLGADAGIAVDLDHITDGLSIGLVCRDFTKTSVHWSTGHTDKISPELQFGISKLFLRRHVQLEADAVQLLRSKHIPRLYAGIEGFIVKDHLSIRTGYQDGQISFGAGLGNKYLKADYTFVLHKYLDNTHRISISITLPDAQVFKRRQTTEKE